MTRDTLSTTATRVIVLEDALLNDRGVKESKGEMFYFAVTGTKVRRTLRSLELRTSRENDSSYKST